jgi:small subunit ribosomal protein S2
MSNNIPEFTMANLLDAGVHFGHKTMRWNPKMAPYIYGAKGGIHIIDLRKTVPLLHRALQAVSEVSSRNGRILFVSTKRQASTLVAEAAKRSGQYYVNHRWLGGMLTNWHTVSQSIKKLKDLEAQLADTEIKLNKKEALTIERKIAKLQNFLGGIREMGGKPDLIFVIDTTKEHIAIQEAKVLGIPVIAVADTNSDPDGIDFLIPGNDDATRAIKLYCDLIADTAIKGLESAASKIVKRNEESAKTEEDKKETVVQVKATKVKNIPSKGKKDEGDEAGSSDVAVASN